MKFGWKVVMDCADPEALAPFWAGALGYRVRGAAGAYVVLVADGDAQGPPLILQRVPEPKSVKNRVHIDVQAEDVQKEAARLESLGARRVTEPMTDPEVQESWIVMTDPQGNEFCVCAS